MNKKFRHLLDWNQPESQVVISDGCLRTIGKKHTEKIKGNLDIFNISQLYIKVCRTKFTNSCKRFPGTYTGSLADPEP